MLDRRNDRSPPVIDGEADVRPPQGAALFGELPADGLLLLAEEGKPQSFAAGAELMRQGEPSDVAHVITSGRVRVERVHPSLLEPLVLAELGPGEVVGEMGVLDGAPRSATVIAEEPTETVELSVELLKKLLDRYPRATAGLLRILSMRLRSTDELIAYFAANNPVSLAPDDQADEGAPSPTMGQVHA